MSSLDEHDCRFSFGIVGVLNLLVDIEVVPLDLVAAEATTPFAFGHIVFRLVIRK